MEIQGRECKEVKIGEHTYWFIEKYKGEDIRKTIATMVIDGKLDTSQGAMLQKAPELFSHLCLRIDEDIKPSVQFMDELSVDEFVKLDTQICEECTNLFTQIQ